MPRMMSLKIQNRSDIRSYLKREQHNNGGRSNLCIVAARAKVSEGDLLDIVYGGDISQDIVDAITPLMEHV